MTSKRKKYRSGRRKESTTTSKNKQHVKRSYVELPVWHGQKPPEELMWLGYGDDWDADDPTWLRELRQYEAERDEYEGVSELSIRNDKGD